MTLVLLVGHALLATAHPSFAEVADLLESDKSALGVLLAILYRVLARHDVRNDIIFLADCQ